MHEVLSMFQSSDFAIERFLPIGYKDVLRNTESINQSGNCNSSLVRTAPDVIPLEHVIFSDDHLKST